MIVIRNVDTCGLVPVIVTVHRYKKILIYENDRQKIKQYYKVACIDVIKQTMTYVSDDVNIV